MVVSLAGRVALACAVLASLFPADADAQKSDAAEKSRQRLAAGRVTRPSANGAPEAVAGLWVVLHRVGSDRAAPLDSMRSGPDGRFRIRYRRSGSEDALYFVSARYHDIAYFSPPLRADTVRGGDADVVVYETSTDTSALQVQGRHFVLSMPRGLLREVAEIFELENNGTKTIVARDSTTPLWSTQLPAKAESATVAPGDFGAGAVVFRPGRADLYAPISPGVRQLILAYRLPAAAFPLSQPVTKPVGILEVLLEEPRAMVEGARLAEVASVSIEGRSFRRFLAHDVPAPAVMRFTTPPPIARNERIMSVVAAVIALCMAAAFALWMRKTRQAPMSDIRSPMSEIDHLVAELAALDARFEREPESGVARAAYERERAALKVRLEQALAAERMPA